MATDCRSPPDRRADRLVRVAHIDAHRVQFLAGQALRRGHVEAAEGAPSPSSVPSRGKKFRQIDISGTIARFLVDRGDTVRPARLWDLRNRTGAPSTRKLAVVRREHPGKGS